MILIAFSQWLLVLGKCEFHYSSSTAFSHKLIFYGIVKNRVRLRVSEWKVDNFFNSFFLN